MDFEWKRKLYFYFELFDCRTSLQLVICISKWNRIQKGSRSSVTVSVSLLFKQWFVCFHFALGACVAVLLRAQRRLYLLRRVQVSSEVRTRQNSSLRGWLSFGVIRVTVVNKFGGRFDPCRWRRSSTMARTQSKYNLLFHSKSASICQSFDLFLYMEWQSWEKFYFWSVAWVGQVLGVGLQSNGGLDIMWLTLNYPYFLWEVTPTSIFYASVSLHKSECHRCLPKIIPLD